MSKRAFIFPGQGSQYAGMGKDLADTFPVARQVFEEADDALGSSLSRLCFEGPEEQLKLTANTQPAILTTSVAAFRVLQAETGLTADFLAGHSLGEYSALVAAGALGFADAVRTVRARGTFMQEAVPVGEGAMAAMLGIEPAVLAEICAEAAQGEVVSPANFNSPGQIVIAGNTGAVNRAIEIAKAKGFRKAMLLPVSAPFHSSLMVPAGERLAEVLAAVAVGDLVAPVVTNVEATPNSDKGRVKELLVRQVSAPVLWDASVREMVSLGVTRFVEIGPGKVLSGLVKRIEKEAGTANVEDTAGIRGLA
ncbi:ACP S-malonyltransferase [Geobacter sulfurreducens]|jgi:[acyl-carrier-protein] S-malonyltransferase|uniref:Malonyl CoA-acyl carrier protein transacylase n=1 Tax=Geobacter sulfurreducens (strain ATCC 51573 / DSM 12127 / PCA) TaxID=243231 RepID=Q74CS0_GEOSL|nr:ACP S-malonyltransferase [Geobacter sulfurreducens]AAR34976.1 malonyl-CoA--acyl carrier protein transacylase [Geobacter sulfurreducens PCA]ADI84436.1 malonyl-CoA--acyl carrier protein transacylase [Geobacter sulfurreducens KN400]AJY71517.1 ACP S-malonyltransferase [Geobacter sulfurreducens]QVW36766.1 ACP S-malonyltransferase [Geobacter sulfurreducens]UAC05603.1 ACP S-malonyltransferase [Geobacter sulfurreducens]